MKKICGMKNIGVGSGVWVCVGRWLVGGFGRLICPLLGWVGLGLVGLFALCPFFILNI